MKRIYLLLAVICYSCATAVSQPLKVGHVNSVELLQLMPEIKKADSSLLAYQKQLEEANQTMLSEYQAKLTEYQKGEATMADAIREVKQQEIADLQRRITDFQQTAQDRFQAKKEELYTPILKKAEDAIKAVAKESGYSYVFDTSAGAVIYAQPSDDIMHLVKKKLGLK
ncbi:MAG: OmpH family outer membrane protein [Chitinophagales bacterium]|nr:OmpH family outer membrane protein [Chitinophagales bacterium]MDW8394200.1 OmpH family outer membrane protein [Chitinophagales bacterium]